jgi:hypothetical protein
MVVILVVDYALPFPSVFSFGSYFHVGGSMPLEDAGDGKMDVTKEVICPSKLPGVSHE